MIRLQCTEYLEDTRSTALNTLEKYHNAFELFFSYGHYLWATPLTIIYVTVLLYTYVGVSAVFGVAVVLLQSVFGICSYESYNIRKNDILSQQIIIIFFFFNFSPC